MGLSSGNIPRLRTTNRSYRNFEGGHDKSGTINQEGAEWVGLSISPVISRAARP